MEVQLALTKYLDSVEDLISGHFEVIKVLNKAILSSIRGTVLHKYLASLLLNEHNLVSGHIVKYELYNPFKTEVKSTDDEYLVYNKGYSVNTSEMYSEKFTSIKVQLKKEVESEFKLYVNIIKCNVIYLSEGEHDRGEEDFKRLKEDLYMSYRHCIEKRVELYEYLQKQYDNYQREKNLEYIREWDRTDDNMKRIDKEIDFNKVHKELLSNMKAGVYNVYQ